MKKSVDLVNDTIKICLMASGFAFNRASQNVWADVSASELATGNGYTQNTKTLANKAVTESDANFWGKFTCDDITWTASGGDIGPTPGAILYDDTHLSDIIIGWLDFGENKTVGDTSPLVIQAMSISLVV
jgi:hypothetical protein